MKVTQERTYSVSTPSGPMSSTKTHTLCDIHHGDGNFRIKMSSKSYQRLNNTSILYTLKR